mgnify:CR=1 FL=1
MSTLDDAKMPSLKDKLREQEAERLKELKAGKAKVKVGKKLGGKK